VPIECLHTLLRTAIELVERLDALTARLADAPATRPPDPPNDRLAPRLVQLSDRENRVLELLTDGLSNRQIARTLGLAEPTVKNHLSSIFRKLEVSDRTQAVALALRRPADESSSPIR
jgi:DNA-binding NarL/FixJ family response regulator